MDMLTFLLALASSARLTRLIVADSITLPLRERLANHIVNRSQEGRSIRPALWFQDLTNCEWCTGVWVAAAITPLAWAGNGHTWFLLPASILTVSYLIGVAAVVLAAIEEI